MAMEDPRDPRQLRAVRPVTENIDKIAGGLDATLTMLNAQLGEVIKTQQDGNALLEVLARSVSGERTIGRGVGGVRPPVMSNFGAKTAIASNAPSQLAALQSQAQIATTGMAGRRTYEPYTAGIDYSIETGGGAAPLGAQTRGGIRHGVANWLTGRSNYYSDQYAVHRGEGVPTMGPNRGAIVGPTGGSFMDEQGRYRDIFGRYMKAEDAVGVVMTAEQRQGIAQKAAHANIAGRVGEAWGEGQPIGRALLAGLPTTALKAAGGAAVAVTAANQAWQWAQGQAAQQRTLQEAYGGSMGDNFGDRASQWVNRNITGRFSLLGSGNYDQLFQGAMNEGLRGSQRGQYISTGANIMGQGVNAQQTKQILDMSVEAGLGLSGLATAIKEVNSAARDAGVNARRAREIFIANYTAGTEVMFGSQQAKTFATQLTEGQLAQARPYQGINTTGTMQKPAITQAIASGLGMTYGQLEAARTRSATGTILQTEQFIKARVDATQLGDAPMRQLVDQFVTQNRGYSARHDQVALGTFLMDHGWNSYQLSRLLDSMGVDYGGRPELAPGYVGNLYTSDSAGSVSGRLDEKQRIDFAPQAVTADRSNGGGLIGSTGQLGSADAVASMRARALQTIGASPTMGRGAGDLAQLYLNSVAGQNLSPKVGANWDALNGKKLDVGVERLIKQSGSLGITKKSMVSVKTGGGWKVITLEEAIRDFPDQVGQNMTFESGVSDDIIGKTGAEISGAPKRAITSDSKVIDYGMKPEEFAAEQKKKAGESGSDKVTFDLSAEAKRILIPALNAPYYAGSAPTSGSGT